MRTIVIAMLLAGCAASEPDVARDDADLYTLAPQQTRAGTARFTTDVIHDPRVAAVFVDRLRRHLDDERTRGALAEALPRTGADVGAAMLELVAREPSAAVRSIYVHGARRVAATAAVAIARRGFADADRQVRLEAARTAGALRTGRELVVELRAALVDADSELRTEAARALGILGDAGVVGSLQPLLVDPDPGVRRAATRALGRLTTPGPASSRARTP